MWIRDFLRAFADDGGTVLLSSHLLREVELLADAVLVIVQGRKVADLTRAEIATLSVVRVVAKDMESMRRELVRADIAHEQTTDGAFEVSASADDVGLLAARHGIALRELGVGQGALESMFFTLSEQGGTRE